MDDYSELRRSLTRLRRIVSLHSRAVHIDRNMLQCLKVERTDGRGTSCSVHPVWDPTKAELSVTLSAHRFCIGGTHGCERTAGLSIHPYQRYCRSQRQCIRELAELDRTGVVRGAVDTAAQRLRKAYDVRLQRERECRASCADDIKALERLALLGAVTLEQPNIKPVGRHVDLWYTLHYAVGYALSEGYERFSGYSDVLLDANHHLSVHFDFAQISVRLVHKRGLVILHERLPVASLEESVHHLCYCLGYRYDWIYRFCIALTAKA